MLRAGWTSTLILSVVLLVGTGSAALAADHHSAALVYLAEKLSVPVDDITLGGHIMDLPNTGEQFWVGRYRVSGEEGGDVSVRQPLVSTLPVDKGELDKTGTCESSGLHAGVVYIRTATGEILGHQEAMPILAEERHLEQLEWERARQEAGNICVSLYRRLEAASSGDVFPVIIRPVYVETDEMRAAIDEIMSDYSDLERWWPRFPGGRIMPRAGTEIQAPDAPQLLPMPEDRPDSAAPDVGVDPRDGRGTIDHEWYERYSEMRDRLEKVYREGFSQGLARIAAVLDGMDVVYRLDPGASIIKADLILEQVLSLRDVSDIESILGDGVFHAMDSPLRLDVPTEPRGDTGLAETGEWLVEACGDEDSLWWYVSPSLLFLCTGAVMVITRRRAG